MFVRFGDTTVAPSVEAGRRGCAIAELHPFETVLNWMKNQRTHRLAEQHDHIL